MNTPAKLTLAAFPLLCLGISQLGANDLPASQCIELSSDPEQRGLANPQSVKGRKAYLYVERTEDPIGRLATSGMNSEDAFMYQTPGGRLLVRILDIPPGHGWFGPF